MSHRQVWHKWTCETDHPDIFCMLVHSCTVDDGHGDKIELLNKEGFVSRLAVVCEFKPVKFHAGARRTRTCSTTSTT